MEEEKPKLQMKIMNQDDSIEDKVKELIDEWKEANLESEVSLSGKEMTTMLAGFEAKLESIDKNYSAIAQAKKILGLDAGAASNKLDTVKESVEGLKSVWTALGPIRKDLDEIKDTAWNAVQPRKILGSMKKLIEDMEAMGR